jgi:hypothetical protein
VDFARGTFYLLLQHAHVCLFRIQLQLSIWLTQKSPMW